MEDGSQTKGCPMEYQSQLQINRLDCLERMANEIPGMFRQVVPGTAIGAQGKGHRGVRRRQAVMDKPWCIGEPHIKALTLTLYHLIQLSL